MVSKANDDLPDPESPVITVNAFLGISKDIFLKLCSLAPWTDILLTDKITCFTFCFKMCYEYITV